MLAAEQAQGPPNREDPPVFTYLSQNEEEKIENEPPTIPPAPTQDTERELDRSLAALDLDATITTNEARRKLRTMIAQLLIQAIITPVQKFHQVITLREEITRIRRITTQTTTTSTVTKVAATILREQPPERPVLSGLIRDETQKSVKDLKRKLQSAMDKIERNQKLLKTLSDKTKNNDNNTNKPTNKPPKNYIGGDLVWTRGDAVTATHPSMAAAVLPHTTPQHNPTTSTTTSRRTQHQPKRSGTAANDDSHTAAANASAARRRRRNKMRLQIKSSGRTNNSGEP
jgi:hypothetical protein